MVEFAVAAAIFLLRDVFSLWTLWYLSPKLIQILRQLDLTTPLGYDGAADLKLLPEPNRGDRLGGGALGAECAQTPYRRERSVSWEERGGRWVLRLL